MNLRRNSFRILVVIWLLGLAVPRWRLRVDDFKAANQLYDAGKFAEAAAAYEKIEPKTAHVYYNLGNAWFRQGKLGLAVLNYERARRLAPRDPDILANLKFAQQRLGVDEVNTPPRAVQRFLRSVIESRTSTEWSAVRTGGTLVERTGDGGVDLSPENTDGIAGHRRWPALLGFARLDLCPQLPGDQRPHGSGSNRCGQLRRRRGLPRCLTPRFTSGSRRAPRSRSGKIEGNGCSWSGRTASRDG